MARIRSSISLCICGVQLLVSPKISTLDGTALCAPSVKSSVQEITAASKGEAFLETTVCNARMIWGSSYQWVDAHMGAGSVEAFSFDLNAEVVLTCHNAAGFSMQFSFWKKGCVVDAINLIHWVFLQKPVIDHGPGAFSWFFCRLEDTAYSSIEITAL